MATTRLTRRDFLRLAGMTTTGAVLAACGAPAAPTSDQATPAAAPAAAAPTAPAAAGGAIVTPQGRTLPADAAPVEKQVLYEAAGEPKHLDISRDIYNASAALNWGGEPLLRRDQDQNLVPALAESFTVGPNAEYFDFVIRKDAKWSDGTPITPDDYVFTFRHLADPKLDNPWTWFFYDIKGVQALKEGKGGPDGVGVEKLNDRTVRIHAQGGPAPHIPALLAYQAAAPAPKHKAEQNPEHWADTAEGFVSSGPMKLIKWEHNQRLEWEINPYYNGPHKPGIQHLVQLIGAQGTVWFNAWLNKEIDLISGLQPQEVAQVKADPNLAALLHSFNNFQTEYLALDTLKPPLDNLKLRQALSHALDRDTLSNQVMNGTRIPAFSMLPPGFPGYNPELKSVQTYDVAKAKSLLAEAGYPEGKDPGGNQLTLDLFSNGREAVMEFVKDQWERNLGIAVNLQVLENAVWGQKRSEHAMMIYKGPYEYDYLDPANMLTSLWRSVDEKGSPRHAWKSAKFDELVNAAGREVDDKKRIELYQQAERLLIEDVGGIFLTHQVIFQIWWPYLAGIPADKSGNVVFRFLDLSRFQMYIRNDVDKLRTPH
jgi:oligopeptide transport system substrate-binding protein